MNERFQVRPSFYLFWGIFCLLDEGGLLPVFAVCAVLHECGHGLAAALLGGRLRRLTLDATGAHMELELPGGYGTDALVTLAGPVVGFASALAFGSFGLTDWAGAGLLLNGFNCLPLLPLDGGRLLEDGLCASPLGVRGRDIAEEWSRLGAVCLAALGAAFLLRTGYNSTLLLMGLAVLAGVWHSGEGGRFFHRSPGTA